MSSLAVVLFLRPFLWGILAFRIVETVCKPFTLFHSKWETKLRYQGQLNHPTPRMTNKLLCSILPHVPWAPLHPTISPSLKRKRICYAFILFKVVCHFSMVNSQKHHYTNKPTSQHSFIIAYVAILMASEGNCRNAYIVSRREGHDALPIQVPRHSGSYLHLAAVQYRPYQL